MQIYRLSRTITTALPEGTFTAAMAVAISQHEAVMTLVGDSRMTSEQAQFWLSSPDVLIEQIGPASTDYLDRRGEHSDVPHLLMTNRLGVQ